MLKLTSVTKTYGPARAVDRVSLQVDKGEVFGLLGPNGAGKTTIVKMIMGLVRPTAGTLTVNDLPAADPASRAKTGYLAEQQRIPPRLTGREYLARSAALIDLTGRAARAEIDRVLELCGMRAESRNRANGYSKGMQQRIGLAAALLGGPQLLVLDEPTAGLDPFGIRDIRCILESLNQAGATIVINSHILSEVEKICDTVALINHGRLLAKDRLSAMVGPGETLEEVFVRAMEGKNG
ncbi:MAG: ABC transporter ATP-binding protein [Desulfobacterales bacterium]|nr:ABC transporter ATP-binding protein [Desulfobacterales bacterium]